MASAEETRKFSSFNSVKRCSFVTNRFELNLDLYGKKLKEYSLQAEKASSKCSKAPSDFAKTCHSQYSLNNYCDKLRLFQSLWNKRKSTEVRESLFLPKAKKLVQKRNTLIIDAERGNLPKITDVMQTKSVVTKETSGGNLSTILVENEPDEAYDQIIAYNYMKRESSEEMFAKRNNTFDSEQDNSQESRSSCFALRSRKSSFNSEKSDFN